MVAYYKRRKKDKYKNSTPKICEQYTIVCMHALTIKKVAKQ